MGALFSVTDIFTVNCFASTKVKRSLIVGDKEPNINNRPPPRFHFSPLFYEHYWGNKSVVLGEGTDDDDECPLCVGRPSECPGM